MRFRILVLVFLVLTWLSLSVFSKAGGGPAIPEHFPNKKLILDYIAAFNSGDEAQMSAFIKANVADKALQQRSLEERLTSYRDLQARMQSLELKDVLNVDVSAQEQAVTTIMRTGAGETVEVTFNFDPHPPNKLMSLRIQQTGDKTSGPPQRSGTPLRETDFKNKVESYLDEAAGKDDFSGVVLVARHGKPIFEKAYGFADQKSKQRNNLDTKFNLGSINKLFTKICVDQLVKQGKISYDDKITKFLAGYPNKAAAEKVTVRQLVDMTSGIGDFFGERYRATPKEKIRTLKDYLALFDDKPLLFEPGTKTLYSNGGYVVLGLIIQKASGQDYYQYVKEHVFLAAGMKDTDFYFSDENIPNVANGYTRQLSSGGERQSNEPMRASRGSSAGGGYSTVYDLLSFAKALAENKIPGATAGEGIGIAGGFPGTNAALEIETRTGNCIVVLSNYDPPIAETTARQIRGWLRDVKD